MGYLEDMYKRASSGFSELHSGVTDLVLTDFPDHANVGDSAIFLGEHSFWQTNNIDVHSIYSLQVAKPSIYDSQVPVFIHGGGNLGDLYPIHNEHRYKLAENLRDDTLLVQYPQSVHFSTKEARLEFDSRMAKRSQLRIAVRDNESYKLLESSVSDLYLIPDAVHLLGKIPSAEPHKSKIRLLRQDSETTGSLNNNDARDWGGDGFLVAASWWLSWRSYNLGVGQAAFHRGNQWWLSRAEKRFLRGVELLASAEVVETDRLHAMLIALQLGRKVIVHDNAQGKISKYVKTWFTDFHPENLVVKF